MRKKTSGVVYLDDFLKDGIESIDENIVNNIFRLDTIKPISMNPSELFSKKKKRDKYKPKLVRGEGIDREGLCEECDIWLKLKTSSYWYHMNFKHGISVEGKKYPEPVIIIKLGRAISVCNFCGKNICLGTNSRIVKYNWYKHFQKEHRDYKLN